MRATFTYLLGPKKGQFEQFKADRITVGRAPDNMLSLGDDARRVSSHHAEVIRRGPSYLLRDLGSTNGTMINGRRVIVSELRHDDLIEFGAGGPLVRFGFEQNESLPFQAEISDSSEWSGSKTGVNNLKSLQPPFNNRRSNAMLIVAVAMSMLAGALAGLALSSRVPERQPQPLSFSEIADINGPGVVFIRVEYEYVSSNGETIPVPAHTGSGFVVSPTGLIVTNRHVVRDWEYNPSVDSGKWQTGKIEVFFPSQGQAESFPARVEKLSANREIDVAILKVERDQLPSVRGIETDLSKINKGDEVAVLGYPLGMQLLDKTNDRQIASSLSTGVVSLVGQNFIQLYMRAFRGASGGPVFNRRGDVIGIITANIEGAQDYTLATPITAAMDLIRQK